jgi:hypothetical protein
MAKSILQKLVSPKNTFTVLIFLTILLLIITLHINYKRFVNIKEDFYFDNGNDSDTDTEEEDDDEKEETDTPDESDSNKEEEDDVKEETNKTTSTPNETSNSINLNGKTCKITIACD